MNIDSIINFFHIVNSDFNSWQYVVAVFSSLILGSIFIITSRNIPHIFHRYLMLALGNFSWIYGCILLLRNITYEVALMPETLDNTVKGVAGILPLLFAVIILLLTFKLNTYAFPNKAQPKENANGR